MEVQCRSVLFCFSLCTISGVGFRYQRSGGVVLHPGRSMEAPTPHTVCMSSFFLGHNQTKPVFGVGLQEISFPCCRIALTWHASLLSSWSETTLYRTHLFAMRYASPPGEGQAVSPETRTKQKHIRCCYVCFEIHAFYSY